MNSFRKSDRRGFTLLELLIVLAVITLLLALILPAIGAARESARNQSCRNNLRQLAIAEQNYESAHGEMPPTLSLPFDPRNKHRNVQANGWYFLFPYIGQNALYKQAVINGRASTAFNGVREEIIPTFICSSDHTNSQEGRIEDWHGITYAVSSYASNDQIFTEISFSPKDPQNPSYSVTEFKIESLHRHLPVSVVVTDGTSNAIMLTEKVARCENTLRNGLPGGNARDYMEYGGQLHPYFGAIGLPLNEGSVGPRSVFQASVTSTTCDPELASTCHPALNTALADGSARALNPNIDKMVWWRLLTPNDGKVIDF